MTGSIPYVGVEEFETPNSDVQVAIFVKRARALGLGVCPKGKLFVDSGLNMGDVFWAIKRSAFCYGFDKF